MWWMASYVHCALAITQRSFFNLRTTNPLLFVDTEMRRAE
jgi:hypothetical protein